MKTINYSGSSKLISRIVSLLNRKAPLPFDGNGDPDWGTSGQVLSTDGAGSTAWVNQGGGGGGDVTDVEVNGTSVVDAQGVANVTVPTATSDLNNDSGFIDGTDLSTALADYTPTANLAAVATSGDYDDLLNKPSIPAAQVNSDWNAVSGVAQILNKPTIPTVNDGTLTIQQNGTTVGTFSANQSGNTTVNLTGGGSYSAGDGIDITNNAISVDTAFTEASTRANIASGDSLATIWGKIKKFFTDLKTVAFTGSYNDLTDKPSVPGGENYVLKAGDTMIGTLNMSTENNVALNFRPGNGGYYTSVSYQTGGNEACVFATKNAVTSWMFINGEDSITNHSNTRWQALTPALQIKNNCVAIGKLIANGVTPSYKLDVDGVSYTKGLIVQGRAYNSGDDEGIVVLPASNGLAGLILGSHNARRSVFYLRSSGAPLWRYNDGTNGYEILHPAKSGTVALTSDIPNYTAGGGINLTNYVIRNTGVRSLGINGNYLRYNLDGSDFNITVPYATNSSFATSADIAGKLLNGKTSMEVQDASLTQRLALQSDYNLVLYKNGSAVWSTGTSSRRFKHNIQSMTEERARKILQIRAVTFDWNDGLPISTQKCDNAGVIAEEVSQVIPDVVVFEDYDNDPNVRIERRVEYERFTPYLIKMVQMQQKQIDTMQATINALEQRLSKLEGK